MPRSPTALSCTPAPRTTPTSPPRPTSARRSCPRRWRWPSATGAPAPSSRPRSWPAARSRPRSASGSPPAAPRGASARPRIRHARRGGRRRLDPRTGRGGAADAIAIASSFSGGLNQTWIDGSSEYRIQLGMAARNGITAATLAAGGMHGAARWYEGDAGFARAFADGSAADAEGAWELGERWRLLTVTYKPFPVCAITQSPVTSRSIWRRRTSWTWPTSRRCVACSTTPTGPIRARSTKARSATSPRR